MKIRYWLLASLVTEIISTVSSIWSKSDFLSTYTELITIILLACAYVTFIINKSGIEPTKHLLLLKRFIIILFVIAAITFIACTESFGADDPDAAFTAMIFLISLFPLELALIIISYIAYRIKKKKYMPYAEEDSEDDSDETKL